MKPETIKKILLSFIIFFVTLLALSPILDAISYDHHHQAFERSLATFAIAKALNAVISALQGTEIHASAVVVGVTTTVGEFLDPLNDMIERFSWIMLASTIALGIEKLLIDMGSALGLKTIIALLAGTTLLCLWIPKLHFANYWASRIFAVFMIIRLLMPLLEGTNTLIYAHYTEPMYLKATNSLNVASSDLQKLKTNLSQKELSFFERLQERFEETSKEMISMMVIFVLHSILLPLVFLWGGFKSIVFLLQGKRS